MQCPYCNREMRSGVIHAAANEHPYWTEADEKRTLADRLAAKGELPAEGTLEHRIESFYCGFCKKIIIDAELKL